MVSIPACHPVDPGSIRGNGAPFWGRSTAMLPSSAFHDKKIEFEFEFYWVLGAMCGKGWLKWGCGDKYDGEWLDGFQHGHGIYT